MIASNPINSYQNDMLDSLRRLISVKSVQSESKQGMPFGEGPARALQEALSICSELGFDTVNLDNYVGYAQIGQGEELIGILCHVDVVPEGSGWNSDPYQMIQDDGYLYGRGVTDDKGPAIMAMYAMKILLDRGIALKKRIRLVLGANEESGSECVKYYRKKEGGFTLGFSPDAEFPLIFGEKGTLHMNISITRSSDKTLRIMKLKGGEAKNIVAANCECIINGAPEQLKQIDSEFAAFAEKYAMKFDSALDGKELRLTLIGRAAHASTPHLGVNAITHMLKFLSEQTDDDAIRSLYDAIGTDTEGNAAGIACNDQYGALTMSIGMIEATKANYRISVDIRYPITIEFDPILSAWVERMQRTGVIGNIESDHKPLFVPPESDLVQELYRAYSDVSGDSENQPFTIGGGTYSREFENVVAFGPGFPGEDATMHMPNERLKIEDMLLATEVYVQALLNLLSV